MFDCWNSHCHLHLRFGWHSCADGANSPYNSEWPASHSPLLQKRWGFSHRCTLVGGPLAKGSGAATLQGVTGLKEFVKQAFINVTHKLLKLTKGHAGDGSFGYTARVAIYPEPEKSAARNSLLAIASAATCRTSSSEKRPRGFSIAPTRSRKTERRSTGTAFAAVITIFN